MFHKILVCSDGSDDALYAARAGAVLAKRFGAEALLLDVFNPVYLDSDSMGVWGLTVSENSVSRLAHAQHDAVTRQALPVFEAAGVSCKAMQELGHPVGVIADVAAREHADLIVLGSRGVGGLKAFVMGSVSGGVAHHAPCAVLILRGEDMPPGSDWFQNILLASDGSETAHKAAGAAIDLAKTFHGSLTVLNVVAKPGLLTEITDAYGELYPVEIAARLRASLEQNVENAALQEGVTCAVRQEQGHPAETILNVAEASGADLIVVGSRGLGGFQSLLLGSVSGRVLAHAACPVLVAR